MTHETDTPKAKWEALLLGEPRGMPEDFAPEMWVDGDVRCARYQVVGGTIQLGYKFTPEYPHSDDRLDHVLKQSIWQAAELLRLNRTDEATKMIWDKGWWPDRPGAAL